MKLKVPPQGLEGFSILPWKLISNFAAHSTRLGSKLPPSKVRHTLKTTLEYFGAEFPRNDTALHFEDEVEINGSHSPFDLLIGLQ